MRYLLLILPIFFASCGKIIQTDSTNTKIKVKIIENIEATYFPVKHEIEPSNNSWYYDIDGMMNYTGYEFGMKAVRYGYHKETDTYYLLSSTRINYDEIKWR